MIEIRELQFSYGTGQILDGFSMNLSAGSFTALVGPNGTGKSTLLKCLIAYQKPQGGLITVDGRPLADIPRESLAKIISYIPQTLAFQFDYTVRDIVLMGRFPWLQRWGDYSTGDVDIAEQAMRRLDIADFADRPWNRLSGGEQQRVSIARALVQECPVMLLDESLANLDLNHQIEIMTLLRNLSGRKTVLLVSHNVNLVSEFCDRIVLMKNGKKIGEGTPETVITTQNMHSLFGMELPVRPSPFSEKPVVYPTRPDHE